MEAKDFLLVILPILTAISSSYLTYLFAAKSKKNETIREFKEEKYSNLVVSLQGFVGSTASGDTKKKFFEEQYKSWLYSSDEVVKSINNLIELVIYETDKKPNPEKGRELVGKIILAMRKDLLDKTNLNYLDFRYTSVVKKD